MSLKTENYGTTQRKLDVAQARVVALHQLVSAAQTVFTAVRSPSTTEQRIELLERMVLLQTEAMLGILPVLQEHDGQIDAAREAVEVLRDGIFGGRPPEPPEIVHSIHNVHPADVAFPDHTTTGELRSDREQREAGLA